MKKLILLLPLLTAFTGGCAWYKIQPVSTTEVKRWNDPSKSLPAGYIIYQPELYFSATITTETVKNKDGKDETKQNVAVTPLYLPNYSKAYRVTTHNILAKADFGFDFENGWKLTKLSDKGDNSTLANTLAGELGTILKAAGVATLVEGAPKPPKTRVILYRPTYDETNGYFKGFDSVGALVDE